VPNLNSFALASVILAASAAPVMAQETPPKPAAASREGVIGYAPADFAASRPNTALDMVNRLPGFTLDSGDQVRGFAGAAGNVLIDGQRPTSKSEQLSDTLARIPINQVERIDIIRGGAAGIDMQGRTVIANVIRKHVDSFQQVATLSGIAFARTGHTLPGWDYEATLQKGEQRFDLELSRGIAYDDSVGYGTRTTVDVPTNTVTLLQHDFTEADGLVYTARGGYKGPLAGGVFSANGQISTDEFKDEEHFYSPATDERYMSRSANDRGEIGLNYKRPIAEKFEIEVLGLSKLAQGSGVSTGDANGSSSLFDVNAEAGESIGRGILRYTASPTLSFEGGGEAAYNYRKQQIAFTQDHLRVALPASDVKVEETRGEGFLQGTWRPSPKFTLEAGVREERSTITETGDEPLERSFVYPKPRLLATWSPTKSDQVRVRIERVVGQLDFQDFISNTDLNSGVLSAGNSDLRPSKTWAYEIAFEKRFWGGGAAVLTLRHEDITDVVDRLPFLVGVDANGDGIPDDANNDGVPDQVLVSGIGNIGDGSNDVAQLNLTLPLEKLGIKGGELKVNALFQSGHVHDPLTHESRNISGQRPNDVKVNYRQDLPAWNLSYGFTWYPGWSERRYLLEEVDALDLHQFWASFVEYKPTPKFTLRAEIDNFDPYHFSVQRREFDAPRNTGSITTIETERRQSQIIGMVRARWTIG
jgi:outer membrane receptor protein involved in Fe transport